MTENVTVDHVDSSLLHHRRSLLELEFGNRGDFDDPALEWRRLFSELLGTFFLVLVGAGSAVVDGQSGGAIGRAASVVAPGLTVMAIILFMGAVSGAHLNPGCQHRVCGSG
jgi:aquaporin Z